MDSYCSNCGKPLQDGDLFCRECGKSLTKEATVHKVRFNGSKKRKVVLASSFLIIAIIIVAVLLLLSKTTIKPLSLSDLQTNNLIPSKVHVDSIVKISLRNKDIKEYLVYGVNNDNDREPFYFGIYSYDISKNAWGKDFSDYNDVPHSIDTGSIDSFKEKLFILSDSHGSGGFLNYKVFGYSNGCP